MVNDFGPVFQKTGPFFVDEATEVREGQMLHWTYSENLENDNVIVSDAEAHHLIHVLRCRAGDEVTLFDGKGTEARAEVVSVTRRDLTCSIRSRIQHTLQSRPQFTVIASPPKADRLKMMVEKLTEIGVDRLVLLNTARTVTTPGETRLDKIHSNMIAACKQSRRPFFMELNPLQSLQTVLSELQSSSTNPLICIAHPGIGTGIPDHFSDTQITRPRAVLIGPEGGFTEDEVRLAFSFGAVPVSWPSTILRIETAAIVFAALLMSRSLSSPS